MAPVDGGLRATTMCESLRTATICLSRPGKETHTNVEVGEGVWAAGGSWGSRLAGHLAVEALACGGGDGKILCFCTVGYAL